MMTSRQYARAKKMWADGVKVKVIAMDLGLKEYQVMDTAVWHRDDFPKRKSSAHLTDEQITAILSYRAEGRSIKWIAIEVCCSKSTVEQILRIARKGKR